MTIKTELVHDQVRLTFTFDYTVQDRTFIERITKVLATTSFNPVTLKTDNGVVDTADDVFKVTCASKSALLACCALEELKTLRTP